MEITCQVVANQVKGYSSVKAKIPGIGTKTVGCFKRLDKQAIENQIALNLGCNKNRLKFIWKP